MPHSLNRLLASLFWVALAGAALGDAGCGANATQPIFAATNAKYGIATEFFGTWVGPDQDPKTQFSVTRVVVRKAASNASAQYRPADADAAERSLMYFRDVWSPDLEYLVLPAGRFDGFAVFNSRSAVPDVKSNRPADSVSIRYRGQARSLPQIFRGWSGGHALLFDVQFETSSISFSYDLGRKELSSPSDKIDVFDAVNLGGSTPIHWLTRPDASTRN